MKDSKRIRGGIYLVIDPQAAEGTLLGKLSQALDAGVAVVQVWDHFRPEADPAALMEKIAALCHAKNVPLLINNRWQLLQTTSADGVHFDEIPGNFDAIKRSLKRNSIFGLTVNNDPGVIRRADELGFDYLSFCSVFPSSTANSCELVKPESILEARKLTRMPIFLAGGIRTENIKQLQSLDFDGIAIVSGIMSAADPAKATTEYVQELNKLKQ